MSAFDPKRTLVRPSSPVLVRVDTMPVLRLGEEAMRRREFISLLGGAAAWPFGAQAQQQATPVIGFLRPTGAADAGHLVAAVRQGLRESGYPSDRVAIESRWAEGRPEQLPKLAAELVALQVTAIVGSVEAALALKGITDNLVSSERHMYAVQTKSGDR